MTPTKSLIEKENVPSESVSVPCFAVWPLSVYVPVMFDALPLIVEVPVSLIVADAAVTVTVPLNVADEPVPVKVMFWNVSVGALIVAIAPTLTLPGSVTVCVPLSAVVTYC